MSGCIVQLEGGTLFTGSKGSKEYLSSDLPCPGNILPLLGLAVVHSASLIKVCVPGEISLLSSVAKLGAMFLKDPKPPGTPVNVMMFVVGSGVLLLINVISKE